jgi:hypothetical protein
MAFFRLGELLKYFGAGWICFRLRHRAVQGNPILFAKKVFLVAMEILEARSHVVDTTLSDG